MTIWLILNPPQYKTALFSKQLAVMYYDGLYNPTDRYTRLRGRYKSNSCSCREKKLLCLILTTLYSCTNFNYFQELLFHVSLRYLCFTIILY